MSSWKFCAGGCKELLIHKEIWIKTFSECLNPSQQPRNYLIVHENERVAEFYFEKDLPHIFESSKRFLEPDFLEKFLEESERARKKFWELASRCKRIKLENLDNQQLSEWLRKYLHAFRDIALCFWTTQQELFIRRPELVLREKLSQKIKDDQEMQKRLLLLIQPTELNVVEKEKIGFAKIRQQKYDEDMLKLHALRYPWLLFNTFDERKAIRFLKERVAAFKGESIEKEKVREEQNKLLRDMNDSEITYLAYLFQKIGLERFELKACWAGASYVFLPLFREIAKRLSIDIESLLWHHRSEEIFDALDEGKLNMPNDEIDARAKAFTMLLTGERIEFHSGEHALEKLFRLTGRKTLMEERVSELKGTVACPGKVTGVVRIVQIGDAESLRNTFSSFKKDEILVVSMLQPTMVPLLEKIKAVITDEGGITSHAAIVCREQGIPCIVGTGTATRTFRNGDVVDVNAYEGVIRLIKSNKV